MNKSFFVLDGPNLNAPGGRGSLHVAVRVTGWPAAKTQDRNIRAREEFRHKPMISASAKRPLRDFGAFGHIPVLQAPSNVTR